MLVKRRISVVTCERSNSTFERQNDLVTSQLYREIGLFNFSLTAGVGVIADPVALAAGAVEGIELHGDAVVVAHIRADQVGIREAGRTHGTLDTLGPLTSLHALLPSTRVARET